MTRFLGAALLLLIAAGSMAAPAPTPEIAVEVAATPTDPAVVKAVAEVKKARDAWDKARLETTVYEKRRKRAYDQWVRADRETKPRALARRDRAQNEFDLSVERRRLAWYRWEDARARLQAAESAARRKTLALDIERVRTRIQDMERKWGLSPAASPKPQPSKER